MGKNTKIIALFLGLPSSLLAGMYILNLIFKNLGIHQAWVLLLPVALISYYIILAVKK